ncbi:MAG TPA: MTAP family purine nucleoside phosphorylase [Methanoregulaceae archaeon]|nr:MTAP family purine nucleoside phosphorylase [Methanoregulaceae archaeon]
MTLAIIGGTSIRFSSLPSFEERTISTPYGKAEALCGEVVILQRHQGNSPPHRINHCANLAALAILGVDRIVAFGSSGSLKLEIPPGSLVIPSDFISQFEIPSVHDHAITHIMPEISARFACELAAVFPQAIAGGTYVQTRGPRLETVAEVKALARIADIVGMTLGSEATLARELGMEFAAICTVDNYANGISEEPMSWEQVLETSKKFSERTREMIGTIIERFG